MLRLLQQHCCMLQMFVTLHVFSIPKKVEMEEIYPKFYRKEGKCARVDSSTEVWTITLPPQSKVPLRDHSIYESPERLQEHLAGMDEVDGEQFRSFYFAFIHGVEDEYKKTKTV